MSRPNITIHNTETNEIIERKMNDNEFATYEAKQELEAVKLVEAEAKATAKAALLDRLGITAEEAALLLS
jgi:hypothetical protein